MKMMRMKFALLAAVTFLPACGPGSTAPSSVVRVAPTSVQRYLFINHFAEGTINSLRPASTPSGRGVLILPVRNGPEKTQTLTVLGSYRYTYRNVAVAAGDRLQFVAAKPYSIGIGVRAFVDIISGGVTKRVVDEVLPPAIGDAPIWKAFLVPMSDYANQKVSIVFGADQLPADGTASWVVFGEPQLDGAQ